ncbi:hypothetical protein [Glutamicibacter sp. AOP5-A2-18]|uniref:hypothetical protein n=1 Tax=Glutamicibacter sp. AOP5-A2-18 TaxID=3457656 RepID=UPI0040340C1B
MSPEELRACITFANGIDPRVQMTAPNAQLWGRTIGNKTSLEVTTAIQVYYERPRINGKEHPAIDPASVRKIINEEYDREIARQRALEPPKGKAPNPLSWRQRNPDRWDKHYTEGQRQFQENASRLAGTTTRGVAPF